MQAEQARAEQPELERLSPARLLHLFRHLGRTQRYLEEKAKAKTEFAARLKRIRTLAAEEARAKAKPVLEAELRALEAKIDQLIRRASAAFEEHKAEEAKLAEKLEQHIVKLEGKERVAAEKVAVPALEMARIRALERKIDAASREGLKTQERREIELAALRQRLRLVAMKLGKLRKARAGPAAKLAKLAERVKQLAGTLRERADHG